MAAYESVVKSMTLLSYIQSSKEPAENLRSPVLPGKVRLTLHLGSFDNPWYHSVDT
jgi:hypothetical protein